jgi:hypothetical protein
MYKLLIFIFFLFNSAQLWADFDLFSQDRGKAPEPPPAPVQPPPPALTPAPPPAPKPPPPPQKDFMLKGTTKFGKHYQVFLQTPEGKDLIQEWTNNAHKNSQIEGFSDFSIINVTSREVVIRYPDSSPCQASHLDRGVVCAADQKTATLKMIRGNPTPAKQLTPLPSAPPAVAQITPAPNAPQPSAEAQRLQALFQQAAQQQNLPQNPPALKPGENPPPGMKTIKTPFGDRLVPETK